MWTTCELAEMSEPESSERERSAGEEKGLEWSKVLPLNSRRLSTAVLRKIAHPMGLPVSVTGNELRQLIEGKLISTRREPKSVQVMSKYGEEAARRSWRLCGSGRVCDRRAD